MEKLSGYSLDDVSVHRNSLESPQFQALAHARGTEIHLAPGQEEHLPHEAWHVIQQMQGRVKPTMHLKDGSPVNNDEALEREADRMGRRALQTREGDTMPEPGLPGAGAPTITGRVPPVMQLQVFRKGSAYYSDLDPTQEFKTEQDALDFEARMQPPPPISGGRSATLFTHTATKSHNKLSTRGIPQGPHTVGHAAIETALYESRGKIALKHLISEQVSSPEEWRDMVNKEYGRDMFHGKNEESLRILRAYQHYNGLYQELLRTQAGQSTENPYDLIHELIQLHPYSVYKFTAPKGVTKKQLKHKGETRDLSDPKNIDTNAKFKDKVRYMQTVEDRLLMLDPDYNPEEDEDVEMEEEEEEEEEES